MSEAARQALPITRSVAPSAQALPVTSTRAVAAAAPAQAKRAMRTRLRDERSATAPTNGSSSAMTTVEMLMRNGTRLLGSTSRNPSRATVPSQSSPSARSGQAAAVATAVRYGPDEHGADRGDEGGVRPVVDVPGALLPPAGRGVGEGAGGDGAVEDGHERSSCPSAEHRGEHIGTIAHQAVHAEVEQALHVGRVVDRPDVHLQAHVVGQAQQARRHDAQPARVLGQL